eukprot:3339335-Amphidinium_carterae.1
MGDLETPKTSNLCLGHPKSGKSGSETQSQGNSGRCASCSGCSEQQAANIQNLGRKYAPPSSSVIFEGRGRPKRGAQLN